MRKCKGLKHTLRGGVDLDPQHCMAFQAPLGVTLVALQALQEPNSTASVVQAPSLRLTQLVLGLPEIFLVL